MRRIGGKLAPMPRRARAIEAKIVYHVLNRGNGRMRLFHKDQDYAGFEKVLAQGLERHPVDLLSYCLMPNHWHLVLRPRTDAALSRLMSWVGVTHVRRHHEQYHHGAGGHLYQGRFKSFPVQDDLHLLVLCRYVEANALRARLTRSAERWPWCSLYARLHSGKEVALCDWPVQRPRRWAAIVNELLPAQELADLRLSVSRGRPYGDEKWVRRTARRLGLEFTLRPVGRPPKKKAT
jgi:putative transposase